MNLNRTAIRKALKDYKEAKRQQAAILKDQEIQKCFELEEEQKARNLIVERYPIGQWQTVHDKTTMLIESMIKDVPAWKGLTADDVRCADHTVFTDLVALAERV